MSKIGTLYGLGVGLTTAMPAKKSWMLSVKSSWHAVKRHVFWKNTEVIVTLSWNFWQIPR